MIRCLERSGQGGSRGQPGKTSVGGLVFRGLVFALLNSLTEEALFRGVFMHTLKTTMGSERTALILQAVVFGLVHVRGFPSGPAGMMVAGLVGLAFGRLRLRTRGILAPPGWLTPSSTRSWWRTWPPSRQQRPSENRQSSDLCPISADQPFAYGHPSTLNPREQGGNETGLFFA